MAPLLSKRSREHCSLRSKKRQRIEAIQGTKSSAPIALHALSWKEVTLPDRLEDAEGFFGLEEIEGVDVVRDGQSGKLEFRTASEAPAAKTAESSVHAKSANTGGDDDEEEWSGFDSPAIQGQDLGTASQLTEIPISQEAGQKEKKAQKPSKKPNLRLPKSDNLKEDRDLRDSNFKALNEEVAAEADVSAWSPLNLSSQTISSLARLSFAKPTPIQSAVIPEILKGNDVIGKASTGSGKTLAFGIPILEHYVNTHNVDQSKVKAQARKTPVALILSPTRELAHQLSAHLADLCSNAGPERPQIATLTGGLSIHKQQRLLADADIVIGTPGRLWEIISGSTGLIGLLKHVQYLVVDEADRLLSEGHFHEVGEILSALDREILEDVEEEEDRVDDISSTSVPEFKRQTLVFSATFQKDLQQKLAGRGKPFGGDLMSKQESMEYLLKKLNFRDEKPKFIDVDPVSQMASGLREGIVECAGMEKDLYLYALLLHHRGIRSLIFANSITSVRRLTSLLQTLNIPAHALHSQMPQKARLRTIERFSAPSTPGSILIATDVAARGLDIPSVQLVLHYHVPRAADMYVHRSGRTARAGKSGSCILLCAPEEVQGVRRLVAKVHARNASTDSTKSFMRTIDLDRHVVARLKPRVTLAKRISDASLAKEKKGHEDNWLKTAAEELGVDYDSEEFAENAGSKKGRGSGRKKAEKEATGLTKGEVGALRAELREMLNKRVNVGVSERYLTAGGVNVDELLGGGRGEFLGNASGGLDIL